MARTTPRATIGAAVTVAILGWTSGAVAMESDEAGVLVRIDHEAAVPPGVLQFAEERVAAVFGLIGIRVKWIDGATAMQENLHAPYTVVLTARPPHENGGRQRQSNDTLGLAAPLVQRAYVYYDRVVTTQIGSPRSVGSILGDVIAHELGHLLLPTLSHSFTGIMRPNVRLEWSIVETFNEVQARHIRSRLRQPPR